MAITLFLLYQLGYQSGIVPFEAKVLRITYKPSHIKQECLSTGLQKLLADLIVIDQEKNPYTLQTKATRRGNPVELGK